MTKKSLAKYVSHIEIPKQLDNFLIFFISKVNERYMYYVRNFCLKMKDSIKINTRSKLRKIVSNCLRWFEAGNTYRP